MREFDPVGSLSPNFVHLSRIYDVRVAEVATPEQIESRALAFPPPEKGADCDQRRGFTRRAAMKIKESFYANPGTGVPAPSQNLPLQASVCGRRKARVVYWRGSMRPAWECMEGQFT